MQPGLKHYVARLYAAVDDEESQNLKLGSVFGLGSSDAFRAHDVRDNREVFSTVEAAQKWVEARAVNYANEIIAVAGAKR